MNILGIDIGALLANPVNLVASIVGAVIAIIACPHLLNYITTWISDAVLYIDDFIIDKLPFPPLKAYFQDQMVNMLKSSVDRYQKLIKKVSD